MVDAYQTISHTPQEATRYSDRFLKPVVTTKLHAKDLNPAFFPPDLWDAYFNPKKRKGEYLSQCCYLLTDAPVVISEESQGARSLEPG